MDESSIAGNDAGGTLPPGTDGESGGIGSVDSDGLIIVDPTSGSRSEAGSGSDSGSGTGRSSRFGSRRGRPPGSGKATGKTALDGVDIRVILISIHGLLAGKFGEHWALDDDEGKQVELAIKRVMRHQNMEVSQKQVDYIFAAYVMATVYGTRVAATFIGGKKSDKEEASVASAPIFHFPQPNTPRA